MSLTLKPSLPLTLPTNQILSQPPPSPCKQISCTAHAACLFLSSWRTFPIMELNKPLLANSGLTVSPALGSSYSLPVDWDQVPDLFSTPHATLAESCLIMASDDCFSPPPPSNAPFSWDSDWRVEVSCCWKCSSTSQWETYRHRWCLIPQACVMPPGSAFPSLT
jgi:hypothetical protein